MEWQNFLEQPNVRPYKQELIQILNKRYSSEKERLKSILLELDRTQQNLDLEQLMLALALQNYPTPPELLTRRQRQNRGIELNAAQTETDTRSYKRRNHLLTLLKKKIYEHPQLRRCHTNKGELAEIYNQAWYETLLYISRRIAEEYDPFRVNGLLIIWINGILSPKVEQAMKTHWKELANKPPEDSLDAPTNNGQPMEISDRQGSQSLSNLVYECVYNDKSGTFASRVQYSGKISILRKKLTSIPQFLLLAKTQKILNNINEIVKKDDKETVDFVRQVDEIAKEFNLEIDSTSISLLIMKLNRFGITWKDAFLCKFEGGNIKALAESKGMSEQNVYAFLRRQLREVQNPLGSIIRERVENDNLENDLM